MSLSQSQLRLVSTIGMGVLVGTSLIVIIPEGIEAVYTVDPAREARTRRSSAPYDAAMNVRWARSAGEHGNSIPSTMNDLIRIRASAPGTADIDAFDALPGPVIPANSDFEMESTKISETEGTPPADNETPAIKPEAKPDAHHNSDPPTFYIGLSLILGFVLMFLIDKLPRHASENFHPSAPPRHISLNNLSQGLHSSSADSVEDEEADTFLHSLTPSPKQTRSLATTAGLVIHAAADGIAMGASASTANMKLGFVIFIAILIHKAPAAFGLTSVLLKQGLSKRAARGHLIVFSLAAPFGALTTWLLVHILGRSEGLEGASGHWWTGMLLLFSAGTFL